jgi:hypothetical protein
LYDVFRTSFYIEQHLKDVATEKEIDYTAHVRQVMIPRADIILYQKLAGSFKPLGAVITAPIVHFLALVDSGSDCPSWIT